MTFTNEGTPLLATKKEGGFTGLGFYSSVAYVISVLGIPPIVALPGALEYCGYLGFVIVFCLILLGTYTAVLLSKSWLLLEDYWPHVASLHSRYPYSALGNQVGGSGLRRGVKIIQNLAIFGESVPFLLLASENIYKIILGVVSQGSNPSFCYILVIVLVIVIPISWLGTAKDLRHFTWIGAGSVIMMCFLVLTLLFISPTATYEPPTILPSSWKQLAYCFGAVAFQYGVHALILTLQNDMTDRAQLPSVIQVAFATSFFLYGAIATLAFFLYGNSVQANLMNNFSSSTLLYIAQGIISIQAVICFTQGINVLFQDLEETFGIPDLFGWRRVCLRTVIMLLVLFVAESIPHFAIALELVGGLLMTPLIFIFPPWFYCVIKYQATKRISIPEIVFGGAIIVLGIVGCISSTVEGGIQISILKEVAPPCYINIGEASEPNFFQ